MNDIITSYSNALIKALNPEALNELLEKKELLELCFKDQDFLEVLKNPFIRFQKKFDFVVDLLEIKNQHLKDALFTLAEAERLILLSDIASKIQKRLDIENRRCCGVLFSPEKIDPSLVALFNQELEQKTGYKVQLDERLWNQDGIKCCIDDLGLEISFSRERLIEDLNHMILSSISERSIN